MSEMTHFSMITEYNKFTFINYVPHASTHPINLDYGFNMRCGLHSANSLTTIFSIGLYHDDIVMRQIKPVNKNCASKPCL